jgi:hypothetical protein
MTSDFVPIKEYLIRVRLVRLLFEGEDACLAAHGDSLLRGVFADARMKAKRAEAGKIAEAWVDHFVAERLKADNRTIPIISDGDEDTILSLIQQTVQLEPAELTLLYNTLGATLDSLATGIATVGQGDGYAGIWTLAGTIKQVAEQYSVAPLTILDPARAEEATEFRTEVFRHCMTPQQWQILSDIYMEQFGSGEGVPEDDITETWTETRALMAQLSRGYYEARKHQIWPDTNG